MRVGIFSRVLIVLVSASLSFSAYANPVSVADNSIANETSCSCAHKRTHEDESKRERFRKKIEEGERYLQEEVWKRVKAVVMQNLAQSELFADVRGYFGDAGAAEQWLRKLSDAEMVQIITESSFAQQISPIIQQGVEQTREVLASVFTGFSWREVVVMPAKEFSTRVYADIMTVLVETVAAITAASKGNELFLSLVVKLKKAGEIAGDIAIAIAYTPAAIAFIMLIGTANLINF